MKTAFVHLVGAIITGAVGLFLFEHVGEFIESKPEIHLALLVLAAAAIGLYAIIVSSHHALNYLWFLCFSKERKLCGLFVEAYFDDKQRPSLSLMVVYFHIPDEELRIAGYAYHQDAKRNLVPCASWESRALHHTAGKDYFDVFYIHDGSIETGEKVLGTTICRLPTSIELCGDGHFCDLHMMGATDLKPQFFEVMRVQDHHERDFSDDLGAGLTRASYLLKLGSPGGGDFLRFARAKGAALLDECHGIDRGKDAARVRAALGGP